MKIAIAAIAIGIIMMLLSVSTGLGLKYKIRDKIAAFNGHVVITNFDANVTDISLEPIDIHQDFYPEFKTVSGIKHLQPFASKAGIIRTEEAFEGVVYKGVDSLYNLTELQEYLIEGRLPKLGGTMSNEILISQFVASRLGFDVGDKVMMHFMKDTGNKLPQVRQFEIAGIYNSGLEEFDANFVIGDLKQVQRLNRWQPDQVGGFEVILDHFDEIEAKGNEIYLALPSTLDSQTIVDKYAAIFTWMQVFDLNIVIIITIMVVVASINMIVALLVLILERTQMIGVLKALGATNWSIRKMFLYNALYLIFKGLLYGNVIGLGLLFLQKYFGIIQLDPSSYHVKVAPVLIRFSDVLLLNVGVVVISMLVLLIPSILITKISPVKAIRFD